MLWYDWKVKAEFHSCFPHKSKYNINPFSIVRECFEITCNIEALHRVVLYIRTVLELKPYHLWPSLFEHISQNCTQKVNRVVRLCVCVEFKDQIKNP